MDYPFQAPDEKKVRQDLLGRTFGRLRVVGRYPGPSMRIVWKAVCTCGEVLYIRHDNLESGRTRSCGCLNREILIERSTKHGMTQDPAYRTWKDLRERCSNKKHPLYSMNGALGIKVCERWDDFVLFLGDMGPKPKHKRGWKRSYYIHREDRELGYTPENCSWRIVRGCTRHRPKDPVLTLAGMEMTLTEWAEYIEIPRRVLLRRMERGLSVKRVLTDDYKPRAQSRK